jgi:hypothetical protein
MEVISYFAIAASSQLAKERGSYSTFEGSLWSQGILPIDSLQKVIDARGERYIQVDTSQTLDWATYAPPYKRKVCVTLMSWRLHLPPPFLIFVVLHSRLSRLTKTCTLNRTYRASLR